MKKLCKELIKNLIGGVIGAGIILLFFYILGIIANFIENHFWLIIPLAIIDFIIILKEVSK